MPVCATGEREPGNGSPGGQGEPSDARAVAVVPDVEGASCLGRYRNAPLLVRTCSADSSDARALRWPVGK